MDKIDIEALTVARERFLVACKRKEEASNANRDLDLDIRIAEREGKPTESLKAQRSEQTTNVWYPAYTELQAATKALVEALGVDYRTFKNAL